jgi:hypothetical protein
MRKREKRHVFEINLVSCLLALFTNLHKPHTISRSSKNAMNKNMLTSRDKRREKMMKSSGSKQKTIPTTIFTSTRRLKQNEGEILKRFANIYTGSQSPK